MLAAWSQHLHTFVWPGSSAKFKRTFYFLFYVFVTREHAKCCILTGCMLKVCVAEYASRRCPRPGIQPHVNIVYLFFLHTLFWQSFYDIVNLFSHTSRTSFNKIVFFFLHTLCNTAIYDAFGDPLLYYTILCYTILYYTVIYYYSYCFCYCYCYCYCYRYYYCYCYYYYYYISSCEAYKGAGVGRD